MKTNSKTLRITSALLAALTITFAGRAFSTTGTQTANASPTYDARYDLNSDGKIDLLDIELVAPEWASPTDPSRDLDGSGQTDVIDVMLIAAHWGSSVDDPPPNVDVTSQKKGIGVPSWEQGYWKNISKTQLERINSQWFYDWGVTSRFFDYNPEYVPMIWNDRLEWYGGESNLAALAAAHPGRYWLIWNEPDLEEQANISPERAAELYRPLADLILGADPTAKLIVGGASQVGWPAWPEQFLAAYQNLYGEAPTLAGWHTHYYPFANADSDPAMLAERTRNYLMDARAWVDSHGGGELWLTEFNVHTTDDMAQAYMSRIVPWLEDYSGVDRYAWFAVDTTYIEWYAGSLMDRAFNLTQLGNLYASY